MAIIVRTVPNRYTALGLACHFLSRRMPFEAFKFGELTKAVDGQILRDHVYFAFEGERMVGFCGWATYDPDIADAYAAGRLVPSYEQSSGTGVLWLLLAAATTTAALNAMLDAGRHRYVGWRVMGVRHKPNGKSVIFNNRVRLRPKSGDVEG